MRSIRQRLCDFFQDMPSDMPEGQRTKALYIRLPDDECFEDGITFSGEIDGAFMLDTKLKVVRHEGKDVITIHYVRGPGCTIFKYDKGDEATLKSLFQIPDKTVAPNLYEATKDLHHACEAHPVGKSMFSGTITEQHWCDWLGALYSIHAAIDPRLPVYAQVAGELTLDLVQMLPMTPRPGPVAAAERFAASLITPAQIAGAAYVLVGAHRRGGQMTRKRLLEAGRSLPTRHVDFFAPKEAEALVKWLREIKEPTVKSAARATFAVLLEVLNAIDSQLY